MTSPVVPGGHSTSTAVQRQELTAAETVKAPAAAETLPPQHSSTPQAVTSSAAFNVTTLATADGRRMCDNCDDSTTTGACSPVVTVEIEPSPAGEKKPFTKQMLRLAKKINSAPGACWSSTKAFVVGTPEDEEWVPDLSVLAKETEPGCCFNPCINRFSGCFQPVASWCSKFYRSRRCFTRVGNAILRMPGYILPMAGLLLFVYDVVSDAVLAKNLLNNDYNVMGGLVLGFMFVHYIPTYFLMLHAANRAFSMQHSTLPATAAAVSKSAVLINTSAAPISGGASSSGGPFMAAVASVLETLHFFFFVLLVVFGLPLIAVMDIYMVLSLVVFPAASREAGYVMRASHDICRQYERIRLPLEVLFESLPQTGLQVFLYIQTRAGTAAADVQVSQSVLLLSLLGSVLNLVRVLWQFISSFRNSGSKSLVEYLKALGSLQGYTEVPLEVKKAMLKRFDNQRQQIGSQQPSAATSAEGTVAPDATLLGKLDGDCRSNGAASSLAVALHVAGDNNGVRAGDEAAAAETAARCFNCWLGCEPVPEAAAAVATTASPPAGLLSNLPPELVFHLGGMDDVVYSALSPFQQGILIDELLSTSNKKRMKLYELGALHLQRVEPAVTSRILQHANTGALPCYLRLESDWVLQDSQSGGRPSSQPFASYYNVVTRSLPEAALANGTHCLVDLQLSRLALSGYWSAAQGSHARSVGSTRSKAVGRGLARMMVFERQLTWLLVDRCDVFVQDMLEAMYKELRNINEQLGQQEQQVASRGQRVLVVVHPHGGGDDFERWFSNRDSLLAAVAPGPLGETVVGKVNNMRELHLIPDYMPSSRAMNSAGAQVLLAPIPRVPGLLDALVPLMSSVLAPKALDLNAAAFSQLQHEEAAAIGACLIVNTTLESLKLRSTGLVQDTLKLMLHGVRVHLCLTALDLSLNNIGDTGVKDLVDAIWQLQHLTSISLAGCGMGAEGADILAAYLLDSATYTRLEELALQDNKPDCATPALEWVCFAFKQRTGKPAKPGPVQYMEGYPAVPSFGLVSEECSVIMGIPPAVHGRSSVADDNGKQPDARGKPQLSQPLVPAVDGPNSPNSVHRLDMPVNVALDLRHLVMSAAVAALAPAPMALNVSHWIPSGSSGGTAASQQEPDTWLLPSGVMYPGGASSLLMALVGSLLHLSAEHLYQLDFSSVKLSMPHIVSLCRGLKGNTTLHVLRLVGCQLDDSATEVVCSAFQGSTGGLCCPSLERLELHRNPGIGDRGLCKGVLPLLTAVATGRQEQQQWRKGLIRAGHAATPLTITVGAGYDDQYGKDHVTASWQPLHGGFAKLLPAAAGAWIPNHSGPMASNGSNKSQSQHPSVAGASTNFVTDDPGAGIVASSQEVLALLVLVTEDPTVDHIVEQLGHRAMSETSSRKHHVTTRGSSGGAAASSGNGAAASSGSVATAAGREEVETSTARVADVADVHAPVDSITLLLSSDLQAAALALAVAQQASRGLTVQELDVRCRGSHVLSSHAARWLVEALQLCETRAPEAHCEAPMNASQHHGPAASTSGEPQQQRLIRLGPVQPCPLLVRGLVRLRGLRLQGEFPTSTLRHNSRHSGRVWHIEVASGSHEVDVCCATLLGLSCITQQPDLPPPAQAASQAPAGLHHLELLTQGGVTGASPLFGSSPLLKTSPGQVGMTIPTSPLLEPTSPVSLPAFNSVASASPFGPSTSFPAATSCQEGITSMSSPSGTSISFPMATSSGQGGFKFTIPIPSSSFLAATCAQGGITSNSPFGTPNSRPVATSQQSGITTRPPFSLQGVTPAAPMYVWPSVRPALMQPQHTMALAWAISQHTAAAIAVGSIPAGIGEPSTPKPQKPCSNLVSTFLLLHPEPDMVSNLNCSKVADGGTGSTAAGAALLEACKVCQEMPLLQETGGAQGAKLFSSSTDVRVDNEQHLLSDVDAAALAVVLLPCDLSSKHCLDFSGCNLSMKGQGALLQLLQLHAPTLCQLDVSGCGLPPLQLAQVLQAHSRLERLYVGGRDEAVLLGNTGLLPELANKHLRLRYQRADYDVREAATLAERKLLVASANGKLEEVQQLLDDITTNPNVVGLTSRETLTPLHLASCKGYTAVAEALLAAGADVVSRDRQGNTPLHGACSGGHHGLASVLFKAGGALDAKNESGHTPLIVACIPGGGASSITRKMATVLQLLQLGANVNAVDKNEETPLHHACCGIYNSDPVNALLFAKADKAAKNKDGDTPLHVACRTGIESTVEMLIRAGVDVETKNLAGMTPLHVATGRRDLAVLEMLITKKPDVNARDKAGMSPLHEACQRGNMSAMSLLLRSGADLNAADENGNTPLHIATRHVQRTLVKTLLSEKPKLGANKEGNTALHVACEVGDFELVNALLPMFEATVSQGNKDGCTALHLASKAGHVDTVQVLLGASAVVNAMDRKDNTPLHAAAAAGHKSVAEMLLNAKADVLVRNSDRDLPIDVAKKGRHTALMHMIQKRMPVSRS